VETNLDQRIATEQSKHANETVWKRYTQDPSTKLFYDDSNLIVVPQEATDIKKELFAATHGSPMIGHVGIHSTVLSIRKAGYTWSNMVEDVKQMIMHCAICQKSRDILPDPVVDMRTTASTLPFATLAIDAIGPLPADDQGHQYILTMRDKFTRKIRLAATKSTDARTAAEVIVEKWILEYGVPVELQSDNGSQYVNDVISSILELMKIHHHRTIPYHPQGNGLVERANQEVMRHLRCLLLGIGDLNTWSVLLPWIEHIINNTVHSALGVSPNTMLYGDGVIKCAEPFAYLKPSNENSVLTKFPELSVDAKTYVEALTSRLNMIHSSARVCQEMVVKKRLEKYNCNNVLPTLYEVGDFVFVVPLQKKSKLDMTLKGPYKIIEKKNDHLYMLQSLLDPTDVTNVHAERLRLFLNDNTPEEDLIRLARFDNKEYIVDKVLDHRGTKRSQLRFLIRWEGYNESHDTWEPFRNLDGCDKLEDYLEKHPDIKTELYKKKTTKN